MGEVRRGDDVEIRPAAYDSPVVRYLVEQVQAEYVTRYGGRDRTPVEPGEFSAPHGAFLVVYDAGEPVGCGGWRALGPDAEVKRMFVVPGARGRGLARRLLAALEAGAAAAGHRRVILETGDRQPEAVALYLSSGYREIPGYGYYRDHAGNRCFAKDLAPRDEDADPAPGRHQGRPREHHGRP